MQPQQDLTEIKRALDYVRLFHPVVTQVYFDGSRWLYTDDANRAVEFNDSIDEVILEAALDATGGIVCAFSCQPASELTEIAPVEDVLTLISEDELKQRAWNRWQERKRG